MHAPVIAALAMNRADIETGAKLVLHKKTMINITVEKAKSSMHMNFSLYLARRAKYIVTNVPKIFVIGSMIEIAAAV